MEIFADYKFYKNSYLLGKQPMIPENEFNFYARQASYEVLDRIKFNFDGVVIEEMKMVTCALSELIFKRDNPTDEEHIPVNIASEKVGEYTRTFKGNSRVEIQRDYNAQVKSILTHYLGKTGYLFRGV